MLNALKNRIILLFLLFVCCGTYKPFITQAVEYNHIINKFEIQTLAKGDKVFDFERPAYHETIYWKIVYVDDESQIENMKIAEYENAQAAFKRYYTKKEIAKQY